MTAKEIQEDGKLYKPIAYWFKPDGSIYAPYRKVWKENK